jgi:deoxyribodipyrimidine photo-lyase
MNLFPTTLTAINERIDKLDVVQYAQTRNYLDGNVSLLSPYISRGVISLPFVLKRIRSRTSIDESKKFIYELCWREYFQRVWHAMETKIETDLNQSQHPVIHHQMITSVAQADTGIDAIDHAIKSLYETGYMHNHLRMYTAAMVTNIGKAHWSVPSSWMYYHLLDGDIASNSLSWQWVAGTFSTKKYFCNQENINTYCATDQQGTFLDTSYEAIMHMDCPKELAESYVAELHTALPEQKPVTFDYTKPLLLYTSYTLDPLWRQDIDVNRVLILEPSHFKKHPVSEKVLTFILDLAKEIKDLQVFCGEIDELPDIKRFPEIISKEHPAFRHFPGNKDAYEWMFPIVKQPKGFTSFWKACEKHLTP